jgi:hypothetical protein
LLEKSGLVVLGEYLSVLDEVDNELVIFLTEERRRDTREYETALAYLFDRFGHCLLDKIYLQDARLVFVVIGTSLLPSLNTS